MGFFLWRLHLVSYGVVLAAAFGLDYNWRNEELDRENIMSQAEVIGAVLMVCVFIGLGVIGAIISNHRPKKPKHLY